MSARMIFNAFVLYYTEDYYVFIKHIKLRFNRNYCKIVKVVFEVRLKFAKKFKNLLFCCKQRKTTKKILTSLPIPIKKYKIITSSTSFFSFRFLNKLNKQIRLQISFVIINKSFHKMFRLQILICKIRENKNKKKTNKIAVVSLFTNYFPL